MELLLSGIFTLIGLVLVVLYVYAFVLLWRDKQFGDAAKLVGTVLFLVVGPASLVYLIYRMFRK